VGVPYIKAKLDQLHKRMAGPLSGWLDINDDDDTNTNAGDEAGEGAAGAARERPSWWRRATRVMRGLFVSGYPWASGVYEALFFVYQVLYLYDHTRYYTPFLHLQRQQVQRLSLEDTVPSPSPSCPPPLFLADMLGGGNAHSVRPISAVSAAARVTQIEMAQETARRRAEGWGAGDADGSGRAVAVRRAGRVLATVWHAVEDYSALALPLVLFVFKFLEWWYAENKQTAPALPTPPPPRPPLVTTTTTTTAPLPVPLFTRCDTRQVVEEAGKKMDGECGLCGKRRTNPAMVAGTGYVFCYPCLHASVSSHGRCPATGLPASPDTLLKLYEST
jgi:peroxin-12